MLYADISTFFLGVCKWVRKQFAYAVEKMNFAIVLTRILAVCDNKLERMHCTTQGTTVFESDENNNKLLSHRSMVEK